MNAKRKWALEQAEVIGFWDGFDSALIGVAHRCGETHRAVYDRDRMLRILERDMTAEEAEEHLSFNIEGAYCGPHTPMIMQRVPSRTRMRDSIQTLTDQQDEIQRLRDALTQIAENRDEPYSADFAKDILERRKP
jgi:hypothetical protein